MTRSNLIDPSGLKTTIVIDYDKNGITFGSHASVIVDNNGDPVIFDPGGQYAPINSCGGGDMCADEHAKRKEFLDFERAHSHHVVLMSLTRLPRTKHRS